MKICFFFLFCFLFFISIIFISTSKQITKIKRAAKLTKNETIARILSSEIQFFYFPAPICLQLSSSSLWKEIQKNMNKWKLFDRQRRRHKTFFFSNYYDSIQNANITIIWQSYYSYIILIFFLFVLYYDYYSFSIIFILL